MTFEIENITSVILREIETLHQADVAKTYALAIVSKEIIDWPKINAAIVARWPRGLKRVKGMAWKIVK